MVAANDRTVTKTRVIITKQLRKETAESFQIEDYDALPDEKQIYIDQYIAREPCPINFESRNFMPELFEKWSWDIDDDYIRNWIDYNLTKYGIIKIGNAVTASTTFNDLGSIYELCFYFASQKGYKDANLWAILNTHFKRLIDNKDYSAD